MELKDYIKSVLIDICEAVSEAKVATETIAAIAPATLNGNHVEIERLVRFEILLSASDSSQKQGKGKIEVLGIGAGMSGNADTKQENSNKINFEVPVYFAANYKKKS